MGKLPAALKAYQFGKAKGKGGAKAGAAPAAKGGTKKAPVLKQAHVTRGGKSGR